MFNKLIKLLGGYTKDEILTEVVKDLYNTIDENDIIKQVGTDWMIGDKILNKGMKELLISEATILQQSKLWEMLQKDIKYQANKKMFEKSQKVEDLIAGKLWLYTLDVINTRLESLSMGRGTFNSDAR